MKKETAHLFLFFTLTLLTGVGILFPYHDFHINLSQGDHGLNLYCFEHVLNGEKPYRDFWWPYGPLLPYYYAGFLKLFGLTIKSVLLGYQLLLLSSGLLLFVILSLVGPRYLAAFAAVWYWTFSPHFPHTYNHEGGIILQLGIILCSLLAVQTQKSRYIYVSLSLLFLLCLVKINIGLSSLATFLIFFWSWPKLWPGKKRWILLSAAGLLAAVALTYSWFTNSLSWAEIQQCFLKPPHQAAASLGDSLPLGRAVLASIKMTGFSLGHLLRAEIGNIFSSAVNVVFAVLILLAALRTGQLYQKSATATDKHMPLFFINGLLLFSCFNMHEFLLTGVAYTFFWVVPFQLLLLFYILGRGLAGLPRFVHLSFALSLGLLALIKMCPDQEALYRLRQPSFFLEMDRAQVYTSNPAAWRDNIRQSITYLKKNLGPHETFLALPYEPLYYFLTGRASPHRLLLINKALKITEDQQKEIIAVMEQKNIRWVIISNSCANDSISFGCFGRDYGAVLARYLEKHFQVKKVFGNWADRSQWLSGHAILVLEKSQ